MAINSVEKAMGYLSLLVLFVCFLAWHMCRLERTVVRKCLWQDYMCSTLRGQEKFLFSCLSHAFILLMIYSGQSTLLII